MIISSGEPAVSRLLSARQAARYLGVSRERVRQAINSGQIPSLVIGSRRMVPLAALERWMLEAGRTSLVVEN